MLAVWHWIDRRNSLVEEMRTFFFYRNRIGAMDVAYKDMIAPLFEKQQSARRVIIGGDQVLTSTAMFNWGGETGSGTCISTYAASCDWTRADSNPEWIRRARERIPQFNNVGIRERAGVQLIKKCVPGSNPVKVPDPVFLRSREDYEKLTDNRRIFKRPTLLAFVVNWREKDDSYMGMLEETARSLGVKLKIIGSQGCEHYVPLRYQMNVGPQDFLRAMRDAKYVITNSFHGLAFCLLFDKQFAFVRQNDLQGSNQNTRQLELLDEVGQSRRAVLPSSNAAEMISLLREPLDCASIQRVLAEDREKGMSFLKRVLQD